MSSKTPELLAPAGSLDAFKAAISAGADAVYLGGSAFNARINAKNFTADDLKEAFRLARLYNKKIYMTLNTLAFDRDFADVLCAVKEYISFGADSFIIQDLGLAAKLRELCPDLHLHASTQMTASTIGAAKVLKSLGFERMVVSRELDRDNLATLCENAPLEIECFVHGALCVCHSGQCLFSATVGKRSGNLGMCAQPCRLSYKIGKNEGYPLSLKDLCLADELKTLKNMGVASLKIEGRMKSPAYVYGVVSIYRTLLDENRNPTKDEFDYLQKLFSRNGFTKDYFNKFPNKNMFGIRSEKDKQNTAAAETAIDKTGYSLPKINASISCVIKDGEKATLTMKARGSEVSVLGDNPEAAKSSPITVESVTKSLIKLGNTPFCLDNIDITIDDGLNLSPAALNALRREACSLLESKLSDSFKPLEIKAFTPHNKDRVINKDFTKLRIIFENSFACDASFISRVKDLCGENLEKIFMPLDSDNFQPDTGVLLPPLFFDSEQAKISKALDLLKAHGINDALCTNIGFIPLLKEKEFNIHGSFRLNFANSYSAETLHKLGLTSITLSPEIPTGAIKSMTKPIKTGLFAYGKLPMMVLENCLISNNGSCPGKKEHDPCCNKTISLIDRTNTAFDVITAPGHRNIILNSVPSYRADLLVNDGLDFMTLYFTTESQSDALSTIKKVLGGSKPEGVYTRR